MIATASNTRATLIKSDMPLGAPTTFAALPLGAGFPTLETTDDNRVTMNTTD